MRESESGNKDNLSRRRAYEIPPESWDGNKSASDEFIQACRDMKHVAANKNDVLVGRNTWVIERRHRRKGTCIWLSLRFRLDHETETAILLP